MNQPLLELRDVSCERDDARLFAPLSFGVGAGDIVQIEGANGIGKTSLLRCIGGLSTRFEGEMIWRGQPLSRSRVAFAADSIYFGHATALKAVLSPRENLRWWLSLHGVADVSTIDATLAKVGLFGYEDTPCYQLSAGQQRRVGLARLFLLPVTLWILDEPFTAIDRHGVAELEGWLVAHANAGGAVLLTTHQPLALPGLQKIALHAEADADV